MEHLMNKSQKEILSFLTDDSLLKQKELTQLLFEAGIKIITELGAIYKIGTTENYAMMLFEMVFLKTMSVAKLSDGFVHTTMKKNQFNTTNDPFPMWAIVRSQLEGFCAFNHIFLEKNKLEKDLYFNLWNYSGLNTRQGFNATNKDTITKKAIEKKELEEIYDTIISNTIVTNLDNKNRNDFLSKLKNGKWQFKLENSELKYISFQKMYTNATPKTDSLFNKIYSMMSLSTHPSSVSVFQFRDMYKASDSKEQSLFAYRFSNHLMAFILRDFCAFSPSALIVFNSLPQKNQILINTVNKGLRGNEFQLNNLTVDDLKF